MSLAMKIVVAGVVVLALLQLVPLDRTNPPVTAEVPAPAEVRQILRRACYDCHSNESKWPWYAYVAPASLLVAYDVHEARDHMNFSTWDAYTEAEQADHMEEIWKEVKKGDMPLWYYLPMHPEARLSDADKQALRAWTGS